MKHVDALRLPSRATVCCGHLQNHRTPIREKYIHAGRHEDMLPGSEVKELTFRLEP